MERAQLPQLRASARFGTISTPPSCPIGQDRKKCNGCEFLAAAHIDEKDGRAVVECSHGDLSWTVQRRTT